MKQHTENNLPEGWIEITLDQILKTLESGSRPKGGVRGIQEGIPSIGGEHINENGRFQFEKIKFVPRSFFKQMKRGQIQIGDILMVKDGATTGKVAFVREDFPYNPAVVNEHVFICRPEEEIYPPFLFYFLFSKEGQDRILENFRGSAQGGINQSFAPSTTVPLAPLSEQKRIVAKVEELLARVNSAKEHLNKVSIILKRFRQAVLSAACSGRLTADWRQKNIDIEPAPEFLKRIREDKKKQKRSYLNKKSADGDLNFDIPDSWSFCFLEDISSNKPNAIRAGPFGSSLTKSCYTPSGYKIYGQEQVIRGDPNYGDYYIDEKKFLELKSCAVDAGDLLISLVGTIGKVLIIPDKFERGIINPRLVKVSLHSEISREYIAKYLVSPLATNIFKRDSHGGTMEILNLRMLKELIIPLPPLVEQQEIVRRVEAMFKLADAVEKRVEVAKVKAEKLTQTILAKAFRGELVPTEADLARLEGRSYESASELLARIKSERESKETVKRIRNGKNKIKGRISLEE